MKNPKERIIISLILLIFIFTLFSIIVYSTSDLSVSARAATLYEPVTNSFVYEKNADQRLPMASTTKIMTALVAIENADLNKTVVTTENAYGTEGSSLYLKLGEALTMEDMLYGLMLRSANDAAIAIAEDISGTVEAFSTLMNNKAASLGLTDTHFTNPHGLDDPNHYTTARELAIITAEALRNPTFKTIVSTYKRTIKSSTGEERMLVNHNKLLKLYDGAIGVKTGFTKRSGRSLVGAAERDGLTFITVTIDAPSDWSDHAKLFDLGFSTLERVVLAKEGQFSYSIPIIGGKKQSIKVKNTEELAIIKKTSDPMPYTQVKLNRYTTAPVSYGDKLGTVSFISEGQTIGSINLYATEYSEKQNKGFFGL